MRYNNYGLGSLESLQDVTRRKFGQGGVDAITNYPFLVRSQIDSGYYMQEEGTARPASTFTLYTANGSVAVRGVTGRESVSHNGRVVYQPGATGPDVIFMPGAPAGISPLVIVIGGAVLAVVVSWSWLAAR